MKIAKNMIWRFFASVKLALITLIILAAASIIGTLIKQGQESSYYVQEYGPSLARLFEILDIPKMYSSWWFFALLSLFAINLVVCSLERIPGAWHMMKLDNLSTDPEQLEKMSSNHRIDSSLAVGAAADRLNQLLARSGWKKPRRLDLEGTSLLFAQKGAWTRLAVYAVHLSILVIFAGALIGSVFGFKAYVFLQEGKSTSNVFLQGSNEPVPLGFELRCDRFHPLSFTNTGGIIGERVDLTVLDPALAAPYQKSIMVNDPLTHRGLSFFKATPYPMEGYFVVIRNQTTGEEQSFRVPAEQEVAWPGSTISFRIAEVRRDQEGVAQQARIHFKPDASAGSTDLWVDNNGTVITGGAAGSFAISFRQLYTSLVLVTKDPGVWIVYLGSILMVVSLCVCFLLSHWRMWIYVTPKGNRGSRILVSGASNKNKPAFERVFSDLTTRIQQDLHYSPDKKK